MSISNAGTFEYSAEFTPASFGNSELVLQGSARKGETATRLVGLNPKIRFWNDRLVLIASEVPHSGLRNVSFPIGYAVNLAAQPGDQLHLVRSGSGGIGLSLLRKDILILAIGAISRLLLGRDLKLVPRPEDKDPLDFEGAVWLELRMQGERLNLRERDFLEKWGYQIYIERCWQNGMPGIDECVSLCLADDSALKLAALRSAVMLANGELRMVSWDSVESFTRL